MSVSLICPSCGAPATIHRALISVCPNCQAAWPESITRSMVNPSATANSWHGPGPIPRPTRRSFGSARGHLTAIVRRPQLILVLVSASIACSGHNRFDPIAPQPPLRCYSIQPDTGNPVFLVSAVALGSNVLFDDFRAAAVRPGGLGTRGKLEARWRQFHGDSIWVDWSVPMSMFGSVGVLLGEMRGDSLDGRSAEGGDTPPPAWVHVRGHRISCAAM